MELEEIKIGRFLFWSLSLNFKNEKNYTFVSLEAIKYVFTVQGGKAPDLRSGKNEIEWKWSTHNARAVPGDFFEGEIGPMLRSKRDLSVLGNIIFEWQPFSLFLSGEKFVESFKAKGYFPFFHN